LIVSRLCWVEAGHGIEKVEWWMHENTYRQVWGFGIGDWIMKGQNCVSFRRMSQMVIVEVRRILDGYEWRRSGLSVSGLDSWDWVRKRIRNKDQNLIWLGMGRMGRIRKLGTGRKDKMMELIG